jgi:hypothetical protein
MNIFEEIQKLNFAADSYVVVGGAALAARGIKETADIDIVSSPELFEFCKQNAWKEHLRPNGKRGLSRGIVEIYLDVNCGNFNPSFQELRNRAEMMNGIPFCNLQDVISFKREYGRAKDFQDIKLIQTYFQSKAYPF